MVTISKTAYSNDFQCPIRLSDWYFSLMYFLQHGYLESKGRSDIDLLETSKCTTYNVNIYYTTYNIQCIQYNTITYSTTATITLPNTFVA